MWLGLIYCEKVEHFETIVRHKISIAQDKYPLADAYHVYESMVGPYEQFSVTCFSLKNFAAI